MKDNHAKGGQASADFAEALAVWPGLERHIKSDRWKAMTMFEQLAHVLSMAAIDEDRSTAVMTRLLDAARGVAAASRPRTQGDWGRLHNAITEANRHIRSLGD